MEKILYKKTLFLRLVGFVASLILSIAAYLLIVNPEMFDLGVKNALLVIYALAFLQALVQLIFFINVWHEKGIPWNFIIFISTVGMIFIIVAFSIWIMGHLNYNMMPHDHHQIPSEMNQKVS